VYKLLFLSIIIIIIIVTAAHSCAGGPNDDSRSKNWLSVIRLKKEMAYGLRTRGDETYYSDGTQIVFSMSRMNLSRSSETSDVPVTITTQYRTGTITTHDVHYFFILLLLLLLYAQHSCFLWLADAKHLHRHALIDAQLLVTRHLYICSIFLAEFHLLILCIR